MNHSLIKTALVAALALAPVCAAAYPTTLTTRTLAQKQAGDDLVVADFEAAGSSSALFSRTVGGELYVLSIMPNGRG